MSDRLALDRRPAVKGGTLTGAMFLQGLVHGDLDHVLREGFVDGLEQDLIEHLLLDEQRVFADR